jgi:hypothetical protein
MEERVIRLTTPSVYLLPESQPKFVPACTLLVEMWQGLGHVFVLAQNCSHVRIFEGMVHIRSVPVMIDATPETKSPSQARSHVIVANNIPAPTDRRRLPVNRDIVGILDKECFALDDGRKRLLYQGGCKGAAFIPI